MAESGVSWGIQYNTEPNITEYDWIGLFEDWKLKESAISANYTTPYGNLRLQTDQEVVSEVINRGVATVKHMSVTQSGGDGVAIYWRGQGSSFDQDAVSPAWEQYPNGGANKDWQYYQVMLKQVAIGQMGGEDLQIGGISIGM